MLPSSTARDRRLRKRSDFLELRKRGSSRSHPLLVLRSVSNGIDSSRIAVAVSRRVSPKAVIRNRVRRRLKESVRQMPVKAGWDLLFTARPAAAKTGFTDLSEAARRLLSRANLIRFDR